MRDRSLQVTGLSDSVADLVDQFEREWRRGVPVLDRYISRLREEDRDHGRAEFVLVDLQQRYKRGLKPSAREYFDRFPELTGFDGRALSLIYEEYCLRIENNEVLEPSEFCERYSTWRHSLASQLAYHRELSQVSEPLPAFPSFPDKGDQFGDFELVDLLGLGGASRVFLARAKQLGDMEVVLKITHDRGDESAIMGRLDHDHIVPINTSFVEETTGFRALSMPYRPGLTLDKVISRFRSDAMPRSARSIREVVYRVFPDQRSEEGRSHGWNGFPAHKPYHFGVAWLGLKLAEALAHAHSRGVYHRDVKPDNILLSGRCGPQFIDFNLAHHVKPADQARAAHRGGTLPYMAREQLQAFQDPKLWNNVGAPADLFSLGLILRELLTLRLTEKPNMTGEVPRVINELLMKRSAPLVPLRDHNSRIPRALESIINRLLAEAPEDRYQSGELLAEDLRRFLERKPLLTARNTSRVELVTNYVRRKSRVAVTMLAIVGLVTILANQSRPKLLEKVGGNPPARQMAPEVAKPAVTLTLDLIGEAIESKKKGDHKGFTDLLRKTLDRPDLSAALVIVCNQNIETVPMIWREVGALFASSKSWEAANQAYRKASKGEPTEGVNHYNISLVEFSQKNFHSALLEVDKALRLLKAGAPDRVHTRRILDCESLRVQILQKMGPVAFAVK